MSESAGNGNEAPKAPKSGEPFLPACPVCAIGKVIKDTSNRKEEIYTCTKCSSQLSETIFGFVYTQVDEKQHKDVEGLKKQTFTKQQLVKLSDQARETGRSAFLKKDEIRPGDGITARQQAIRTAMEKRAQLNQQKTKGGPGTSGAKPEAEAPKAPGEPDEDAEGEEAGVGQELLRELRAEGTAGAPVEDEEDLWWEVDEEALAERKKRQGK